MVDLDSVLHQLARAEEHGDLDELRRIRTVLVDDYGDQEASIEACYKLGLDLLFRQRDIEAAITRFDAAARRKHPFWSAAARTSLGLCYFHQGRLQRALFELRKVAYSTPPSSNSLTALSLVESIVAEQGSEDDVRAIRRDRIKQLRALVEARGDPEDAGEKGFYLYVLGLALRDHGEPAEARLVFQDVRRLGADVVGASVFSDVTAALD